MPRKRGDLTMIVIRDLLLDYQLRTVKAIYNDNTSAEEKSKELQEVTNTFEKLFLNRMEQKI